MAPLLWATGVSMGDSSTAERWALDPDAAGSNPALPAMNLNEYITLLDLDGYIQPTMDWPKHWFWMPC